jgi:hypothetical protein
MLYSLNIGDTYEIKLIAVNYGGNEWNDYSGHNPGLTIDNLNVVIDPETNGIISGGNPVLVPYTFYPGAYADGASISFVVTSQMLYTDANGVGVYYEWSA